MKAGQVIAGRYRLESRLGVGGMGEVWRAGHTGTGREFAIKFMHAHAAQSENARQRFSREARASAKINHPNIIDVFDVGELDDGVLYLVMELLDGVALGDAFHAVPPLSVQDFLSIVLDTAQALAAAHAVGIVHRDIKPANIFLHRDRGTGLAFAKILDFGISKFTNDDVGTKTGSILGSPRYMSPEQTRSAASADARADIWAMGVMMFEGVSGTWPHEGDSFSALVVNICTVPPRSIDELAPHLPEALRAMIRECLLPLDERIKSAGELAAKIEVALDDPSLASLPLPRPQHAPGEGIKSTTGLRVRPPSLSSSRNQARQGGPSSGRGIEAPPSSVTHPFDARPPPAQPMPMPAPVPRGPSQLPPLHQASPSTPMGQRASVPHPAPMPQHPQPPYGAFATQVMPGGETLGSDAATLAVEPSQPARPVAHDAFSRSAPRMQPTEPYPHQGHPHREAMGSVPGHMSSQGALPPPQSPPQQHPSQSGLSRSQNQHPHQHPQMPNVPAQGAAPRPPDPLVASVSAMNIDAASLGRTPSLQDSANIAPASQRVAQADVAPLASIAPARSTKRLGIAAAVLAVALLGIVVALVATIRSTGNAEATAEPSASAAAAAAPGASAAPVVAPAEPARAPEPTADPAPSASGRPSAVAASPPVPTDSPATSSKDAAAKDDPAKKPAPGARPPPAPRPPSAGGPPKAESGDAKKPPKHVQDLGSGL